MAVLECTHSINVKLENFYGVQERLCLDCLVVDFVCCDVSAVEVTDTMVTCPECGANYVH